MADETVVEFDAPAFRSTLEKIVANANAALQVALRAEAARLESLANAQVPVESGELKSSSFVDAGPTEHDNPAATMGYEAPYAGAAHEGFHGGKQSKTPRQFWLQHTANQFGPEFSARISVVARGAVGG